MQYATGWINASTILDRFLHHAEVINFAGSTVDEQK